MRRCWFFLLIVSLVSCENREIEDHFRFNGSYAVIGDSISYGKGSQDSTSWTDILKDTLEILSYKKYAVCGAVASSRYPDSQYAIKTQIESIEAYFDLITIMIGINDCLLGKELVAIDDVLGIPFEELDYRESFTHGFVYDLRFLRSRFPDSQIIVVAPPAISHNSKSPLDEYIAIEKAVSQKLCLPFIDVSESSYSPQGDLICSDQIHPTDKGYSLLAGFIYEKMKEWALKPL